MGEVAVEVGTHGAVLLPGSLAPIHLAILDAGPSALKIISALMTSSSRRSIFSDSGRTLYIL